SGAITKPFYVAKFAPNNGNTLWAKGYDAGGLATVDSAGNITVLGGYSGSVDFGVGGPKTAPGGVSDIFLLRLDSNGTAVWVATVESNSGLSPHSLTIDSGGNT